MTLHKAKIEAGKRFDPFKCAIQQFELNGEIYVRFNKVSPFGSVIFRPWRYEGKAGSVLLGRHFIKFN